MIQTQEGLSIERTFLSNKSVYVLEELLQSSDLSNEDLQTVSFIFCVPPAVTVPTAGRAHWVVTLSVLFCSLLFVMELIRKHQQVHITKASFLLPQQSVAVYPFQVSPQLEGLGNK